MLIITIAANHCISIYFHEYIYITFDIPKVPLHVRDHSRQVCFNQTHGEHTF